MLQVLRIIRGRITLLFSSLRLESQLNNSKFKCKVESCSVSRILYHTNPDHNNVCETQKSRSKIS